MSVFDLLANEHNLIRRYLNNAAVAIEFMEEDKLPPKEFFEIGLEFSTLFSDKYHHVKEEYEMFMALAQKKDGEIDAQIAFLRDQHEHARNYTTEIRRSLEGYGKGDNFHVDNIREFLGNYIKLLREHIHREDHVFYPLAQKTFSESELKALEENFTKAEAKFDSDFFAKNESHVQKMEELMKNHFGEAYKKKMDNLPNSHKQ
jgi:hemerythrin-like domain-containing protein